MYCKKVILNSIFKKKSIKTYENAVFLVFFCLIGRFSLSQSPKIVALLHILVLLSQKIGCKLNPLWWPILVPAYDRHKCWRSAPQAMYKNQHHRCNVLRDNGYVECKYDRDCNEMNILIQPCELLRPLWPGRL